MANTEQSEPPVLPLAQAAARLGISPDALRMRIRRGKAEGFKRAGRVYVYVSAAGPGQGGPGAPAPPNGDRASEQQANMASGPWAEGAHPWRGAAGRYNASSIGAWSVVVESQKLELARTLRENERLNERLDRQLDEARQLRQMLEREQVLRQQEQNLRHDLQRILDRLVEQPALPSPEAEMAPESEAAVAPAAAPGPDESHRPVIHAPVAERAEAQGVPDAGDVSRLILRAADHTDGRAPEAEPRTAPEAQAPKAPALRGSPPGGRDEAADLAEMLKEIGGSLRDLESHGERSAAVQPVQGPILSARQRGTLDEDPGDEGPGEENPNEKRRQAARVMTRLLRGRPPPRERGS